MTSTRDVPDLPVFLFELYFLMLLPTKHRQDFMSHTHTLFPVRMQVRASCHLHPPTLPHAQPFLPIQTSPNWPLPSFLISWRDSRGISHISLVFTDKSASLGMPRLQLPIKRQHSPAALSGGERWARRQVKKGGKRREEEEENRVEKSKYEGQTWLVACVCAASRTDGGKKNTEHTAEKNIQPKIPEFAEM